MSIRKVSFLIVLLSFLACNNDDEASQNLIDQLGVVNESVDLSDPDNQILLQNKGYKYIEGGRRGILIVNRGFNEFIAFERNCTFQPNNPCATVSIHPSLDFLVDSCCSSQFDLNGQVLQPPATQPLVRYSTFLVGNELRIQFP